MSARQTTGVSEQWEWVADDLRIPFGLHIERQEYVDVAEVGRGAAAGCICPSCRVPLLARQGKFKRWHFAHETRGTYKLAADQCTFSIWTAMVLMGRQELGSGHIFRTPDYSLIQQATTLHGLERLEEWVTRGRVLSIDQREVEVQYAGAKWDALLRIQTFRLAIVLVHREKRFSILEVDTKSDRAFGIVSIALPALWASALALVRHESLSHREAFRRVLLEGEVGKSWEFHPLESEKKSHLQKRIEALPKPPPASRNASTTGPLDGPLLARKVKCMRCHHRWANPANSRSPCPACGEEAAWIPDE